MTYWNEAYDKCYVCTCSVPVEILGRTRLPLSEPDSKRKMRVICWDCEFTMRQILRQIGREEALVVHGY